VTVTRKRASEVPRGPIPHLNKEFTTCLHVLCTQYLNTEYCKSRLKNNRAQCHDPTVATPNKLTASAALAYTLTHGILTDFCGWWPGLGPAGHRAKTPKVVRASGSQFSSRSQTLMKNAPSLMLWSDSCHADTVWQNGIGQLPTATELFFFTKQTKSWCRKSAKFTKQVPSA
jgi:hypothetical protein